MTKQLI